MCYSKSNLYLKMNGENFFTIIMLPRPNEKFPIVICRSPYVKDGEDVTEEDAIQECYQSAKRWLERGYAYVFQHCRGRGKSSGEFIPYRYEREDGIAFREWIRKQPFYNGELFLLG